MDTMYLDTLERQVKNNELFENIFEQVVSILTSFIFSATGQWKSQKYPTPRRPAYSFHYGANKVMFSKESFSQRNVPEDSSKKFSLIQIDRGIFVLWIWGLMNQFLKNHQLNKAEFGVTDESISV